MKNRFAVPGLILIGLCLLVLGIAWNQVLPSSAYWTPEQAEEFAAAQTELHARLDHAADHQQEFAVAKDRFIKIRDELENARGTRGRMKTVVTLLGATMLLVAIMLHLSQRSSDS
jgi:hypothetical protein